MFLRAFLFSFTFLVCLNLLFMYVNYLEKMDLKGRIPRPNFSTLIDFHKKAQLYYADVQNHMLLIQHGYEKIDTKATSFDFETKHRNWAYFPLHPFLGKLLNFIIKSPFWSLWIINQIVLLSLFMGFYYWSKTNIIGYERMLSAWLVFFFFVIPPLGYFINFITLPVILLGAIFLSLRKWLKSPKESNTAFWILILSSLLIGLSRLQGILLNASLLFFIFIIIGWYRKPVGKVKVMILSLANILPFLIILCLFKYYANDPFAWWKIQHSWGVHLSWPWTPIMRYWKSGFVLNLFNDDLFFTGFRFFVFFIFACLAVKIIIINKNFIRHFISRQYGDSFLNLFFIVISLGLLILPFLTNILVGAHRLMTLAFLIIPVWFGQGRRIHIFFILLLLFVRAVEFGLFFRGVIAFLW